MTCHLAAKVVHQIHCHGLPECGTKDVSLQHQRHVNRTQRKPVSERTTSRGISGITQLTLLEHSLCPLDTRVSLQTGLVHQARYRLTDNDGQRRIATARILLPLGLSASDEFYLWGLLALSLRQPHADLHFAATPHYCLRQLGVIDAGSRRGGKHYELFRQALRRLAAAQYENDAFYDPVRGQHARVSCGFLSYRLPPDLKSERLWNFYWDPVFYEFCQAVRGRLMFDLSLYRQLSPAGRRLFLLLHKVFYRRSVSPQFAVREMATEVLGFSAELTTGVINRKLKALSEQLQNVAVISAMEFRGSRQRPVVQFSRGAYFEKRRQPPYSLSDDESSLVEALLSLGFKKRDAGRISRRYNVSLLREWIDITLTARERFGADHFKRSPQAFLIHHIEKASAGKYSPPDWWRELQKREAATIEQEAFRKLQQRLKLDVSGPSSPSTSSSHGLHTIGSVLSSSTLLKGE
jgi:hypothetical protein